MLRKGYTFTLIAEGKLAEACMCFTTRDLAASVFRESFQALTNFIRLYR